MISPNTEVHISIFQYVFKINLLVVLHNIFIQMILKIMNIENNNWCTV